MWVRDQLGEWHHEGERRHRPESVVYTRRGQPRAVALGGDAGRNRSGTGTMCGRSIDPRSPQYERAPLPDPGDRACRACLDALGSR